MRGKATSNSKHNSTTGITPAHAGKSLQFRQTRCSIEDHPRACGEKKYCTIATCSNLGSPPRMRGKARWRIQRQNGRGITPAHAGKSSTFVQVLAGTWDHPRACGEKSSAVPCTKISLGSPPRMRGKVNRNNERRFSQRITPAHAGKSGLWCTGPAFPRDHPRACGEKFRHCFFLLSG